MTTKRMTRIALCAALLAPCAWLSIPTQPPFTMQTFGVFLTLLLLGARDGAIAIALYILLGAMGAPVFSTAMPRYRPSVAFRAMQRRFPAPMPHLWPALPQ